MEKNWGDLQRKMQEDVSHAEVDVPEALKPDNIEVMLNENADKTKQKNPKHKWQWTKAYAGVAAAACCALMIGGIFGGRYLVKNITKVADDGLSDQKYAASSASLDAESVESGLTTAKDYEEIYEYLKKQESQQEQNFGAEVATYAADGAAVTSDSAVSSATGTAKATAENGTAGYSDTNVRTDGVGEADTIKTDGNYIYTLKDGMYITIVDIRQSDMEVAATIDLSKDGQVSEFYIQNGKLYACYTAYDEKYNASTCIKTFDISNPAEPKEVATVSQSGDYDTMRMVGDYIYLISKFYVYGVDGTVDEPALYVPSVQGEALTADRIYMPVIETGKQYTIISSIDMNQPDQVKDTKALLSTSGMCYVSGEGIYMCEDIYSNSEDYNQTAIRKISYKDGQLTAVGQTKVWGTLNDSFSIDEYEGYLRLVTTVTPQTNYNIGIHPITTLRDFVVEDSESNSDESSATTDAYNTDDSESDSKDEKKETNALYILDSDLNQISKLEGLAEDEQVYSARFMGDTAFFVTYKQTDPLFSVDLSNPKKPKILGELKIPGFSEYLHLYSENLLLGIGMDTDEEGMTTNGVKLSMFDILDPSNVSEINKQVLQNVYGSDVFYDYKSVMIDSEKNLIGFSAYGESQHYYVYSYDDNSGFTCLLDREIGNNWYGGIRGIYAGDTLYVIEGYAIESYDLTTFDKIDDIVL